MIFFCLGEEEINKQKERTRTTSTTIAEEAVDQLQASEKLIAGELNLKCFYTVNIINELGLMSE